MRHAPVRVTRQVDLLSMDPTWLRGTGPGRARDSRGGLCRGRAASGVGARTPPSYATVHVFVDDATASVTSDNLGIAGIGGIGLGECS